VKFFQPPNDYIMPADYELNRELVKENLLVERDFFHDLIARNAGGQVVEGVEDPKGRREFIQAFDLSSVPGETPVRKAISLIKTLDMLEKSAPKRDSEGKPVPGTNQTLRANVGKTKGEFCFDSPAKTAEDLKKKFQELSELSDVEKQILGTDAAKIIDTELKAEHFTKFSRTLKRFDSFAIRPTTKVKVDVEGRETRMRPIKDMSEISKTTADFWVLPKALRNSRLATGQAMVRERVSREDRKILLYVLIDVSGSMKDGLRRSKAVAVLYNRLQSVVRGDGEMFIRFFDDRLRDEHEVTNGVEAKKALDYITSRPFCGPGTNIEECVKKSVDRIHDLSKNPKYAGKADLVIVTDGQDSVSLNIEDLRGIKLHAFICDGANEDLTALAIKSGGTGIGRF